MNKIPDTEKTVMDAINALAQTDLEASMIVSKIDDIRVGTESDEAPIKELRLLATTAMEPEGIAAAVFFIRDEHHKGAALKCHGPPGLMGAGIGDFIFDRKTGRMEFVSFPGDIAHLFPLQALKLSIQLGYVRTGKGIWKDPDNLK